MKLSLDKASLTSYVKRQMDHFFPDGDSVKDVDRVMDETLERVEYCFSIVHDRYFKHDGETYFNHLNSDQYSMFLYFLSNTLYRKEMNDRVCEKLFYLNKLLHGIDVFYSVELPDIFLFAHPMGTVLGKAKYLDYFLVYQNCTIGSNHDFDWPVLGKYLAVYEGASVLGKCNIGENCKISAHSLVMDQDIEDNKVYIGMPKNFRLKAALYHDRIWDPKTE